MAIRHDVVAVGFGFLAAEDIIKMSVKEITVPHSFDDLKQPVKNGLYDPALGPLEKSDSCFTCGQSQAACSGHPGHIQLCVPVYHPLLFKHMLKFLRYKCAVCHKFRISRQRALRIAVVLKLARLGRVKLADDILEDYQMDSGGPSKKEKKLQENGEDNHHDQYSALREVYNKIKDKPLPDQLGSRALEFIQPAMS